MHSDNLKNCLLQQTKGEKGQILGAVLCEEQRLVMVLAKKALKYPKI
jgi:hypothetical protein